MFDNLVEALQIAGCHEIVSSPDATMRLKCGLLISPVQGDVERFLVDGTAGTFNTALELRDAHIHHHAWGHPDRESYELFRSEKLGGMVRMVCQCRMEEIKDS